MPPSPNNVTEPPDSRDDATLALLIAGDPEGLSRLVHDHASRVLARLRSHFGNTLDEQELEDALSRAVTRFWRSANRYPGRGTLRSWLAVIAHNCALSALRHRRRSPLLFFSNYAQALDQPTNKDPFADQHRLVVDVQHCLLDLPPLQRAVLQADIEAGGRASVEGLAKKWRSSTLGIYAARARGLRELKLMLQRLGYRVGKARPKRTPRSRKGEHRR